MKRHRAEEFVYSLIQCRDGSWLLLNRYYAPYGYGPNTWHPWIDYDTHPGWRMGLSEEDLRHLSYVPYRSGARQIWLYDDASTPTLNARCRRRYDEKLALLASLCSVASGQ